MSNLQKDFSESFFNPIIKKLFKNDVEIKNIDISHVVPLEQCYSGELLRFCVSFIQKNETNIQSLALIGKRLIDDETVKSFDEDLDIFTSELNFYGDISKGLEELEYKMKICPDTYYLTKKPKKLIVIEDLSASDFKMASRHEGLNLDHCLLAIEKLAYFHAASLSFYEKNPKIIEQFDKGLFSKNKLVEELLSVIFSETRKACKKEPSLEKYSDKLSDDLLKKCYTASNRDPNFNVLNHGDFFCSNMMFKYNSDGKVQDVVLIDFQLSVFTSQFYDLHYFIATSLNQEVRKNHIPTILNHYYDLLVKNIKILKVKTKIPSRKDFDKDFLDKAYLGLAALCLAVPFVKGDIRKDASFINFLDNGEEGSFRHSCFTNTAYTTTLKWVLPFFESLGLFN